MLPEKIKEIIDDTIQIINGTTIDWFIIKRTIINQCPPKDRRKFSRRHYSTKKHIINSFDRIVINYWEEKTGITVYINPEKIHPVEWKRHRRGWGLKKYNAERQKEAKAANKRNRFNRNQ